jgi:hypothetical protein
MDGLDTSVEEELRNQDVASDGFDDEALERAAEAGAEISGRSKRKKKHVGRLKIFVASTQALILLSCTRSDAIL